jgi:hypothetical protein
MAQAVFGVALALALALTPPAADADKRNPAWSELRLEQQRVLAPIQSEWESLDAQRKRKWLGVAERYPKMSPDAQDRLQRRMKEWVALTPEQRRAARDKYREFEQLGPDERQAVRQKWDQYKQEQAAKEAAAKAVDPEKAASAVESATDERTADAPAPQQ